MYKPPFIMNNTILNQLTELTFLLGKADHRGLAISNPILRKENQIKTIHSTLAIEGNTLSLDQITDVINGKTIKGMANEILEVKNAINVYNKIGDFKVGSLKDFLKAHGLLMKGLVARPGKIRNKNVGIIKGSKVIHAAPSVKIVDKQITKLFDWIKNDKDTNLIIKSCIIHYEIEFIHPFMDGNGRMGRLWQSVALRKANSTFKFLPVETIIKKKQKEYYKSLRVSDKKGESSPFIFFMLNVFHETLLELIRNMPKTRNSIEYRLEYAKEKFGNKLFSRKDYLNIMDNISSATASRDLKSWISAKKLNKKGSQNQTKYYF